MIPVMFMVVSLTFIILRLAPGDPAEQMLGLYSNPEAAASLRTELGLDKPLMEQFALFWGAALRGNLGVSYRTGQPVRKDIGSAFGYTLRLAIPAIIIAIVVGLTLGIAAAATRFELLDRTLTAVSSLALSVPVFWFGLLMMLVFSIRLGWFPASGAGSWKHLVMPALALATIPMAHIMRMVRVQMLDALEQPFVAVAQSKGLSRRIVVLKHALRNALLPVVTQIGLQFGNLLGGAVLTETVFAWPGLGQLIIKAVYARDYPVVQADVIVLAMIYMAINLGVDITYSLIDPRVEHA